MSGNRKSEKTVQGKKPLSHGWIVVPSKTYPDRVYFYNPYTKCSTWENPCLSPPHISNQRSHESSPQKNRLRKTKPSEITGPKKEQAKIRDLETTKFTLTENDEIEEYDELHDQYFENVPIGPFSLASSAFSPPSPDSDFLSKSNLNDFDSPKHDINQGNDNKELWLQFASSQEKPTMKKSLALSDIGEPSTSSRSSDIETASVKQKKTRSHSQSLQKTAKTETTKDSYLKRKKKRKKKEKKKPVLSSESPKKNNTDKIVNKVSFKIKDKTPAQTKLLKLRQQNADLLKKFLTDDLSSSTPKRQDSDSNSGKFSSDSFQSPTSHEQVKNDSFSDAYMKRIEICNIGHESVTDFDEEMDWEPSSEELDVQNINVFRQQQDKDNKSSDIFFGLTLDNTPSFSSKSDTWVLVLDTNILVSCLGFIKELRDTKVPGLGYPVLYIPWRVLQELDHLKDSKVGTVDKQLHCNVRKAISYLNENFKSGHPRCFGQSFEDFAKMVDVKVTAPDDEILQTCIKLLKLHTDKKLMLLTNDKNLESKAIVSGVEVYSKERFQKKYLSSALKSGTLNGDVNRSNVPLAQIDNVVCELKNILKSFIHLLVETEMKVAFEDDWITLAYKKPPWTLQDAFDCLIKHWRSVFFLILSKDTLSEVENLYHRLFEIEPATLQDVKETIDSAQRFVTCIRKSAKKKRTYMDLLDEVSLKLTALVDVSLRGKTQVDPKILNQAHILPSTTFQVSNESSFCISTTEVLANNDISEARDLFKDIWNTLRSFCCSISDVINSPATNSNMSVQEIRLKISQILYQVNELICTVEKLFEISPSDINEVHPMIIHLNNFLVELYPMMTLDLRKKLPTYLSAFIRSSEGRSLLNGSLIDFREFSRELIKATEYFDRSYPSF